MNMVYKNKKELIERMIMPSDIVLDVGFFGQGTDVRSPNWVHRLLLQRAKEVYGIDLNFDEAQFSDQVHYQKASAEQVEFNVKFDVIFAGDLIEHLPNPGLFLDACSRNLKKDGRLIITTPNCFNMFNLFEKLSKTEPTVNKDHTCYFNSKTLKQLFAKMNWDVVDVGMLYSLDVEYKESWKKKMLNSIYSFLSRFTDKYLETLVVTAKMR